MSEVIICVELIYDGKTTKLPKTLLSKSSYVYIKFLREKQLNKKHLYLLLLRRPHDRS